MSDTTTNNLTLRDSDGDEFDTRTQLVDGVHTPEYGIYDSEMASRVHVSHFGALKVSPTHPVLKGNFPGTSLNTAVWNSTTANGGSITVEKGVARIYSGTNSAGSVILDTVNQGIFEAGQVTVFQAGVYAGVGVANNTRRWGLMDSAGENGLFFEWSGESFRVVARKASVDTAVEQADFSGDSSFSPSATNNTYRIHYSAGRAIFQRAAGGRIVTLHTMTDGDFPLVDDLDLGLHFENVNSGNTTNVELRVRGASSSVFGELPTVRADTAITDATIMQLDKSVITGAKPDGSYGNVALNEGNAVVVGDFFTEVAKGNVSGHSLIAKFGRNPDIDSGSTSETIWEAGGLYTFPTAASVLSVVSASSLDASTGTGAQTIQLQGLDENYADASTTIDMAGQSTAVTTTTFLRLNRAVVKSGGAAGGSQGDITIHCSSIQVGAITAGINQTQLGIYTIPAGKTGYLESVAVSAGKQAASLATVQMFVRPENEVFQLKGNFAAHSQGGASVVNYSAPLTITEKSDIRFDAEVTGNNTRVAVAFDVLLVDN